MLNFLIVQGEDIVNYDNPQFLTKYIPNGEDYIFGKWRSESKNLVVYYWIARKKRFESSYYVNCNEDQIELFNGWIQDGNGLTTKLSSRNIGRDKSYQGEYLYFKANKHSEGYFVRNLTSSVQAYYYKTSECTIISNRISLINHCLRPDTSISTVLSKRFISWMLATSWAHDDSSLFDGIKVLKQGAEIEFSTHSVFIREPKFDIWFDEDLKRSYINNPKNYWDDCYDLLVSNLDLYFTEFDHEFEFPISGGKDSRLLLGLILNSKGKDSINQLYTNGPAYSGEVIVGRMVADQLNLSHRIVENAYLGFNMTDKIGKHIFFTEGEVSPMDLVHIFGPTKDRIVLRGQESGLRNICPVETPTRDDVENWFNRHMQRFNVLRILKPEVEESLRKSFEEIWFRQGDYTDYKNLPTKNRIETRFARWGGRIWATHNSVEFSPFLFLIDDLVKMTYNAGSSSRLEEEFHFEMMQRCGKNLSMVPFFNQKWPDKYGVKTKVINHYLVDKRPMRGSHAIMFSQFDTIKNFILNSPIREVLEDTVDWHNFVEMKDIMSGHYQPLWHLFQLGVMSHASNFEEDTLSNIHNKIEGFPILADEVEGFDLLEEEKKKSAKYRNLVLELLVDKETGSSN